MQLPSSSLDVDAYDPGPNGLARLCEDRIAELKASLAQCRTRDERKPINKHLHTLRHMLRWCRTRAGYVATPQDVGLLD